MNIIDKNQVQGFIKEQKSLELRLNTVKSIIKGLQELCDHEYSYSGHDSHYDNYICKICTKQQTR